MEGFRRYVAPGVKRAAVIFNPRFPVRAYADW
jgi:hypothetical protein